MLIDFRELFPRFNLTFKGVLHIGANKGEEFETYNELGVHKQVWIEANPDIFLKLKEHIVSNPEAQAFNFCISDIEGEQVIFNVSNNGSQSSSILELGTHRIQHPDVYYIKQVPMISHRIDSLSLPLDDLDLLNVDLQGADLMAIRGMGDLVLQFKAIYIEVNKSETYKGCAQIDEVDNYLGMYGFQRVETKWAPNKDWGDSLYIRVESFE